MVEFAAVIVESTCFEPRLSGLVAPNCRGPCTIRLEEGASALHGFGRHRACLGGRTHESFIDRVRDHVEQGGRLP